MVCQRGRQHTVVSGFMNGDVMMLVMVQSWLAAWICGVMVVSVFVNL
jgi:hypothetical protein